MKLLHHSLVRFYSLLVKLYVIFVAELMPFLRDKVGLPPNTPLLLYEVHITVRYVCVICTNFEILSGGETEHDRTN